MSILDIQENIHTNPGILDEPGSNLNSFKDDFQLFQTFIKDQNLDEDLFKIYPYNEIKHNQLIHGRGDLVFQVIDDLTGQSLSKNTDWIRNHYFFTFETLQLEKSCAEELSHNFTPFNIHQQETGFYFETWRPENLVELIFNSLGLAKYIFLPLYQDNPMEDALHVSLIVIKLEKLEVFHWDPNGSFSVFHQKDDPRKNIIHGMMEFCFSSYFADSSFKEAGLDFTYIPASELPLYTFNRPINHYSFDKGDCFIHLLLVPYLITKLGSLDSVVRFYQALEKKYQGFLIYNFASYLVQKYPNMIAPESNIVKILAKKAT